MDRFFLGVLVTVLFYNQAAVKRGYRTLMRELGASHRVTSYEAPSEVSEPPSLDLTQEIKEPTLDRMEALGFNVKRQ